MATAGQQRQSVQEGTLGSHSLHADPDSAASLVILSKLLSFPVPQLHL